MENVEINITPMSLKNGVMGLPIQCCRNWDASGSVEGIFQYAGRKSSITFSPKHKNKERGTAAAWQFTVNDSIQFNQLRMDGIHTYVEEISIGEKLICSLCESGGLYFLTVENVINRPETKAKSKNGVSARVSRMENVKPNPGKTISVALTGSVLEAFYQEEEYYSGRDIAYLTPIKDMDMWTMIQYCTIIRYNQYKYSYGRGANRTIGKLFIPDLDEIKTFPKYNQLPDISQIPDYFLNEGYNKACWYLDNIDKDEFEKKYAKPAINKRISLNDRKWDYFKLNKLFDIKKGKRLTKADQTMGDTPFIGATAINNGVTGYIGQEPMHEGNTISLTYNGSIGEAFYQEVPFWASDDVNVLYLKGRELNPHLALFFCQILRLEGELHSYARKWNLEHMNDTKIKLPIDKDGEPDYDFMEQYIKSLSFSGNIG